MTHLIFLLNVRFSDETKVELNSKDKRSKIQRRNFESSLNLSVSIVKHPFSIMFWGCFSFHGTGFLKPIEKTLRSEQYKRILESCLLPSAERVQIDPTNLIFMQDNAPSHKSKLMKEYFDEKQVSVMTWPPQSPDLNQIENLWSIIKYRLSRKQLSNKEDLIVNFISEWNYLKTE